MHWGNTKPCETRLLKWSRLNERGSVRAIGVRWNANSGGISEWPVTHNICAELLNRMLAPVNGDNGMARTLCIAKACAAVRVSFDVNGIR